MTNRRTALSPMLQVAQPGPQVTVAWGEVETDEFKRQSRDYAAHLDGHGVAVETLECVGRNHFDVVFGLTDPRSLLARAILAEAV